MNPTWATPSPEPELVPPFDFVLQPALPTVRGYAVHLGGIEHLRALVGA
jgi:hypothetical protein